MATFFFLEFEGFSSLGMWKLDTLGVQRGRPWHAGLGRLSGLSWDANARHCWAQCPHCYQKALIHSPICWGSAAWAAALKLTFDCTHKKHTSKLTWNQMSLAYQAKFQCYIVHLLNKKNRWFRNYRLDDRKHGISCIILFSPFIIFRKPPKRSFGRNHPMLLMEELLGRTSTDHLGCINTWEMSGFIDQLGQDSMGFFHQQRNLHVNTCSLLWARHSASLPAYPQNEQKQNHCQSTPDKLKGNTSKQRTSSCSDVFGDIIQTWIKLTEVAANHGEKLHTILYTQALYFKTDLNVCIKYRKLRKIELAVISSCYR